MPRRFKCGGTVVAVAGHSEVGRSDRWLVRMLRSSGFPNREVRVSSVAITAFGVIAVTFMMLMYAFERRHAGFVLAFAVGCVLSSVYGLLSGAWPFGVVEVIWAAVAIRRYVGVRVGRPAG